MQSLLSFIGQIFGCCTHDGGEEQSILQFCKELCALGLWQSTSAADIVPPFHGAYQINAMYGATFADPVGALFLMLNVVSQTHELRGYWRCM